MVMKTMKKREIWTILIIKKKLRAIKSNELFEVFHELKMIVCSLSFAGYLSQV